MQARFILDTNTIIFVRQGRTAVVARFKALAPGESVMSAITYGELRFGAEKSRRRDESMRQLHQLSAKIPVMDVSTQVASEYGLIRSDLERCGEVIGPNDLWIAAHARTLGLILVTGNEREFRRIPRLAVENWAAAPA